MDGDGLELVGANGNILFDHNADGIKTGTGWAGADDGLLVRDLNANGSIDSGRELFGVDTLKSNGQLATQGFDALADLDSNADGQITSADTAWSQLQVWRDLNQDGISQSAELFTLGALNITRIGVNGSSTGPQAGQTINNNTVALSTTFTRAGVDRTVGAIDLEANGFFSEIPPEVVDEEGNPVTITAEAAELPQMNGSGMVRNLRAAMSLSGTAADELEAAVEAFAAATTRDAQRALLDGLITEWAQTSSYWGSLESYLGGTVTLYTHEDMPEERYRNMIAVLEAFNGSRFYGTEGNLLPAGQWSNTVNGALNYIISPGEPQMTLLQQAYSALKESVYEALVVQTRLKPYLDAVALTVDETGIQIDTSGVDALLLQRAGLDAVNAVTDILDLRQFAGDALQRQGWKFEEALSAMLIAVPSTPELSALLAANKVVRLDDETVAFTVGAAQAGSMVLGNALSNTLTGHSAAADRLYGRDGNDTLIADGHNDVLEGGAGNDFLTRMTDSLTGTTYNGGTGNDNMHGGLYSDTYVFNRGDGSDVITDLGMAGRSDTLSFGAGVTQSDMGACRSGNDLIITVAGQAGDQITVKNWFSDAARQYQIETIVFGDGTQWAANQMTQLALTTTNMGTAGDDTLEGIQHYEDRLVGGDGNDTLVANGNNDVLEGGAGNDSLTRISDGLSGTTYNGGTGNDNMHGGLYSDTYVFNRGDGSDVITDLGMAGHADTLRLGAGVTQSDMGARRSGNDLVITVAGQAGDQITVKNWFNNAAGHDQIEATVFADGAQWAAHHLTQLALATTNTGTAGHDTLEGTQHFEDRLVGGDGNDALIANGNNDILEGGAGNDSLTRTSESLSGTTYNGGTGSDSIHGGLYNDTYVFNRGDGSDVITDLGAFGYTDTLNFGVGIAQGDIGARRSGNDLIITVAGQAGDQITVKNWFSNSTGQWQIEKMAFAGGAQWSANDLTQLALTNSNTGTAGSDTLQGTENFIDWLAGGDGNDTLIANGHNDVLEGGAGNDFLTRMTDSLSGTTYIGGIGNDTMHGGQRNDIYVFNRGDGSDVITDLGSAGYTDTLSFGAGIQQSDIGARLSGTDLIITVAGQAGDQITVKNWFSSAAGPYQIEATTFTDGTQWTANHLTQLALTVRNTGTAGDDTLEGLQEFVDRLVGGDGNDTLIAKGNNDVLEGGAGNDFLTRTTDSLSGTTYIGGTGNDNTHAGLYNDTFVFNRGDGSDVITDLGIAGYTDTLNFGTDIDDQELWFSRTGDHLLVQVLGDGGQVRVSNWFASDSYRIEVMQLSDGQQLLAAQVDSLVQAMAAFAPPAPGQTSLTPEQHAALSPVIAASWN